MRDPVDWTGIRAIHERCKRDPAHPMSEDDKMEIVRKIEQRLDDWRAGRENEPTEQQLIAALKELTCP